MSHDLDQFAGRNPAITPAKGWPFKRIVILTLLVFVVQGALVIILGEKKSAPVRTAVNAPHFQLADDSSGLIALDDPTLFALPHTNNFGASIWLGSPTITTPSFAYTEPLKELPLDSASLAMNLRVFLTTNDNATALPAFKPEPELSAPEPILTAALNGKTTMQIRGELARRPLMPQPELSWITNLPSLTNSDWVDHTHVQVVVNAAGDVVSAITIPSSSLVQVPVDTGGNQEAEALARKLRFAAAASPVMFGQIIFNWHTVVTNGLSPAPVAQ
jgi:hypothetical protein